MSAGRLLRRVRLALFATPLDGALTLAALALIWLIAWPAIEWAIIDAAWAGRTPDACPNREAACWPFIRARFAQIIYGAYPQPERWRVDLVLCAGAVGLALLMMLRIPGKGWTALIMLTLFPAGGFVLLRGGAFGLAPVATTDWGGLMLTLVAATWGIVTSIPLGLVLALARRSELLVVRLTAAGFIEFWRGVPLIGVLFMAATMFPLFAPAGANFDVLLRALIAVTLFNAAYMAEVFRAGLQAVPRGQAEAAYSLGLGYWRVTGLVLLPQALRIVIPPLVNTCIAIFKETTLLLVIGVFDLLGIIQAGITDPAWLIGDHVRETGYLFAAMGFWVFCFGMSRYSRRVDRRLVADPGQR